jgi:D-sedoheptulose 7-phosphate isomerase
MSHSRTFLNEVALVASNLDAEVIDRLADELTTLKGRLFILGIGGSAANASHAANDFRKLCGIEAYAPTDNIAELTAWTNDEGWDAFFMKWLVESRLSKDDAILILSVGGGDKQREISVGLIHATTLARVLGAAVYSIVGHKEGYAVQESNICVLLPEVKKAWLTPLAESFQSVILHSLTSHPSLQKHKTKW